MIPTLYTKSSLLFNCNFLKTNATKVLKLRQNYAVFSNQTKFNSTVSSSKADSEQSPSDQGTLFDKNFKNSRNMRNIFMYFY